MWFRLKERRSPEVASPPSVPHATVVQTEETEEEKKIEIRRRLKCRDERKEKRKMRGGRVGAVERGKGKKRKKRKRR